MKQKQEVTNQQLSLIRPHPRRHLLQLIQVQVQHPHQVVQVVNQFQGRETRQLRKCLKLSIKVRVENSNRHFTIHLKFDTVAAQADHNLRHLKGPLLIIVSHPRLFERPWHKN